jgi:hypothetical protein
MGSYDLMEGNERQQAQKGRVLDGRTRSSVRRLEKEIQKLKVINVLCS